MFLLVGPLSWITAPSLPDALTAAGSVILLIAFALLIFAGLIGVAKSTFLSFADYFSVTQQAQRQLWFAKAKQEQLRRLFYFKTLRIWHISELSRKHLLKLNNRKHLRSLSRSIKQELLSIKTRLPTSVYQQLQQDLDRFRHQQDIGALLKLQQKITTLV